MVSSVGAEAPTHMLERLKPENEPYHRVETVDNIKASVHQRSPLCPN